MPARNRLLNVALAAAAVSALLSAEPFAQTRGSSRGTPVPPAPQARGAVTEPTAATAGNKIFGNTNLHKLRITMSRAEWDVLQTSAARNGGATGGSDYRLADGRLIHVGSGFAGYFPWTHADLSIDNADTKLEFKDVGVRYKGNLSFSQSSANAPLFANFKLKIDLHGAKGSWDGEKTFNFHAGVVDTSRTRDTLAYAIFRAAGVPASRTAYVELFFTVPGLYENTSAGIFTMIEDVNKRFLERAFPPGTGLVMKPEGLRGGIQTKGDSWSGYVSTYRPDRDATAREQQRMMDFARLVSQSDVALFRAKVGDYLDIDEFLRFIAVNAFIMNTDSYLSGGHNYYIYLNPKDDKVRLIPWDQDLSMGGRPGGIRMVVNVNPAGNANAAGNVVVPPPPPPPPPMMINSGMDILKPYMGDQPLIYWLLDDPAVMTRYRAIIRELSATAFNGAELLKIVNAIEPIAQGRSAAPREFLAGRAAYVQQLVAGFGGK